MEVGRRTMDSGTDYRGQRTEDRILRTDDKGAAKSLIVLPSAFRIPSSERADWPQKTFCFVFGLLFKNEGLRQGMSF